MKLIVGLGNPGKQYERTRHNIGFTVLEKIAEIEGLIFKTETTFNAEIAEVNLDERAKIVKPQTYMNDSGLAVVKIKNYWKIEPEDVWILHDDVDLELGKIRIVFGGSSAGHRGVQSIIDNIGEEFWRIRIGVGKDNKIPTQKRVLQNFSAKEDKKISQIVDKTADLVINSLSNNLKNQTIEI